MKRFIPIITALTLLGLNIPVVAYAAPPPVIRESVGVCDYNAPTHCAAPNSDGSVNVKVTGGTGGTVTANQGTAGAAAWPMKIDQTTPGTTNGVQINAAVPAGTNIIGKTGIDQTTPGTTNGIVSTPSSATTASILPVVSASLESCHVLKASPGNLYALGVVIQATTGIVQVFDATSAPVDGAVTPKWSMPIISNGTLGGASWAWPAPSVMQFATGITVCFSSATTPFTKTASSTASFSAQVS